MTTWRWRSAFAASLFGAVGLASSLAVAQTWPQRTVRVIVPFGPGSGADITARLFAERLAERWKQTVIVENRPGADGLTGVGAFAGTRDDHALLVSFAGAISVFPLIHEKLAFDPARDLVPISSITDNFQAVAASESLKINSLAELAVRAGAMPGKIDYATGGSALTFVFGGFAKSAGLDMVQISYRDPMLAVQDVSEGRIQIMITSMIAVLPQVQAGKVRFLAVINKVRAPIAPEVPTAAEAGFPELTYEGSLGVFGQRGIAAEPRDRIAADIRAVAANRILADRLAAVGQVARGSTPAEFAAAIEEQRAKMAAIARLIGTKPTQ